MYDNLIKNLEKALSDDGHVLYMQQLSCLLGILLMKENENVD